MNLSDFTYIRVLPRGRRNTGRALRDSPPRVGIPASIPTGRRNCPDGEESPQGGAGEKKHRVPASAGMTPGKPVPVPARARPNPHPPRFSSRLRRRFRKTPRRTLRAASLPARSQSIYRTPKTGGPRKCGQMRAAGGKTMTYSTRADGFAAPHRHGGESRNDRRLRHGRSRAARSATEGENMKITRRGRASSARRRWRA